MVGGSHPNHTQCIMPLHRRLKRAQSLIICMRVCLPAIFDTAALADVAIAAAPSLALLLLAPSPKPNAAVSLEETSLATCKHGASMPIACPTVDYEFNSAKYDTAIRQLNQGTYRDGWKTRKQHILAFPCRHSWPYLRPHLLQGVCNSRIQSLDKDHPLAIACIF